MVGFRFVWIETSDEKSKMRSCLMTGKWTKITTLRWATSVLKLWQSSSISECH